MDRSQLYRMTTNFGGKLNLANGRIITKPPNINFPILFSYNNYYHQYLRRLSSIKTSFVQRSFPLSIKSKHAAEIFQGTCPITFALFLMATVYGSNALLSSVWHERRSPVVGIQMSWYTWKPHTQLSTTCVSIIFIWNEFCGARNGVSIENTICIWIV